MLRTLLQSDIDQMLVIEKAVHAVPWTSQTFQVCFQAGFVGWAIEIEKQMIGFIIISLGMDECHILNISIAKEHQRQGFGRKLLAHALDYAKHNGCAVAYLEVRRSNVSAIALYANMQFHLIGERKGYYPIDNGAEDALIFAIRL
jgi:ribosomal-protein-alanine N-acetyltransferase